MMELETLLEQVESILTSPLDCLRRYHSQGKKVFGILPYHFPEELLYAMGIIPMGLWGADLKVEHSKEYFPSFFCGLLQSEMEMILSHRLEELDGIILTEMCDSLKSFSLNVMSARKDLNFYTYPQSMNRKSPSANLYMIKKSEELLKKISFDLSLSFTQQGLRESIEVYNENRRLLKEFSCLCASHMRTITPMVRNHIFKCGYFLDRKEHNQLLRKINSILCQLPVEKGHYVRVVTTGILMDNLEILDCMDRYHIRVVDDDIAMESRNLSLVEGKDMQSLIHHYLDMKGMSVLENSRNQRTKKLLDLVRDSDADGVVYFMTKFCDPEEYDFPFVRNELEKEGVPCILIEVDKTVGGLGQAETILEAFSENGYGQHNG
jgi:(R)-2-hydroxyisocaproyl-CoA dehydratase beta subunit